MRAGNEKQVWSMVAEDLVREMDTAFLVDTASQACPPWQGHGTDMLVRRRIEQ
jgi:hypothetical protein